MTETINWVERRWVLETTLTVQAPRLWQQVRAALQDACASYQKRYCNVENGIDCTPENSHRLRIDKLFIPRETGQKHIQSTTLILFNENPPSITISTDRHSTIPISVDDNGVFVGNHLTPDQLSKQILEPLFFSKQ